MMKKTLPGVVMSSLLLAGCSHNVRPAETLGTTVGQRNQSLSHLSEQSAALAFQHRLNAQSTHGAWLLPAAGSPVVLEADRARLLLQLTSDSDSSQPVLQVKNSGTQVLPPFQLSAIVSVVSSAQDYRTPQPQKQAPQELYQPERLPPGSEVRFTLHGVALRSQQSLLVNVHQFRPDYPPAR